MELKENKTYLILSDTILNRNIIEITVMQVTQKCYKVRFENTNKEYWYQKENFHNKYCMIEDITVLKTSINGL